MVLNSYELECVVGGASAKGIGIGIIISAITTFIIGVIDGYLRPLKCNN